MNALVPVLSWLWNKFFWLWMCDLDLCQSLGLSKPHVPWSRSMGWMGVIWSSESSYHPGRSTSQLGRDHPQVRPVIQLLTLAHIDSHRLSSILKIFAETSRNHVLNTLCTENVLDFQTPQVMHLELPFATYCLRSLQKARLAVSSSPLVQTSVGSRPCIGETFLWRHGYVTNVPTCDGCD